MLCLLMAGYGGVLPWVPPATSPGTSSTCPSSRPACSATSRALPGPVRRWFPLIEAGAGDVSRCLLAASTRPSLSAGASFAVRPGPPVLYGVPGDAGSAQTAALMRIAYSDRHQPAPATTVSAHPRVSNNKPNAPLESRPRAHRTATSARQSRSDLTGRPGAPKARALAKLRYSPWRNYSSASPPLLRPPMPIPAVPIAQSARGPAGRPPVRHHLAAFDDARLSRSSASPPGPRYETGWPGNPRPREEQDDGR
jgi:hypothetical protein